MLFDMEEWYIADGDSLEILIAAQAHVIHMLLLKDFNSWWDNETAGKEKANLLN